MDWDLILNNLFQFCIFPLMAVLTTYLVSFIQVKKEEITNRIDTSQKELLEKYIDMAAKTVTSCVVATNQTYVETLKAQGKFDKEAQEIAFNKTLESVLAILSDEVKNYLTEVFGDLNIYLTILIESQVNENK